MARTQPPLLVACLALVAAAPGAASLPPAIPVSFVPNLGQAPAAARFVAHAAGRTLLVGESESVLLGPEGTLRLRVGARAAAVSGNEPAPGRVNVYRGRDPRAWRTGAPTYASVLARGVAPGVDLLWRGRGGELEHVLLVAPRGEVASVRWRFAGARALRLSGCGDLVVPAPGGDVRLRAPVAWQDDGGGDGSRRVGARYELAGPAEARLALDAHDRGRPLVVDPVLSFASNVGGTAGDRARAVATDAAGLVYVAGETESRDFPRVAPAQAGYGGNTDAFVLALDPRAGSLVYATYLGGIGYDSAVLAVDPAGNAYVTGDTFSPDFPLRAARDATLDGRSDAFVARLDPAGALVWSTYLGGGATDGGNAVAVDASGQPVVAGVTTSADFPVVNALRAIPAGASDGFASRLDAAGAALLWSTYLGGRDDDAVRGVALAAGGADVLLAGHTFSPDFPVSVAQQRLFGGFRDGFVARLDPAVPALVFSTFVGGSDYDGAEAVAAEPGGGACATGVVASADFPTLGALQPSPGGGDDAWVGCYGAAGAARYLTYLGGASWEEGWSIAVGPTGEAWAAGGTNSADFPLVDPLGTPRGDAEGYVARLAADGSRLALSTFLGGSAYDRAYAIAVDAGGAAHVAGETFSPDFPRVTPLPVPPTAPFDADAFVVRIEAASCVAPPPGVRGLLAVRAPAPADVTLTWPPVPGDAYNAWVAADKRLIGSPPPAVDPVAGCNPAPAATCVDAGGVGRPGVAHYQVRALCNGVEGP